MKTDEIRKVVTSTETKQYRVKLANGKTKIVRMWLHTDGYPCIIGKGKKHYGHYINTWCGETDDWVSIAEVKKQDTDYVKRIVRRAKDAQKMLAASGLWSNIKKEIDDFLALSDEEISEFVKAATTDFYENVFCKLQEGDNKFPWLHTYQVFESFLKPTCWKAPNFSRWFSAEKEQLRLSIENKRNYNRRWREGYDNSVEVRFDREDGISRGWYSEEFKDCGNGHYYLLFDATHAIFYEDD